MSTEERRMRASVAAYEAAAEAYQQQLREARPYDAVRKLAALAGRGALTVDVACGPALDLRPLRDAGLEVVAGDLGHEVVRLARLLFPKGMVARWDFRRLPFPDGVFEAVWAAGALQHLPRRHLRAGLAELRRVQRTGPIFVSMPEGSGDLEPFDDPPAGTVHVTSVTRDELEALLLDAGYRKVEVERRPDPAGRAGLVWLHGWGRLPAGGDGG